MTLKQALLVRLTIKPGSRIRTSGGWIRSDRVLVAGREIGSIQTRRGCRSLEVITLAERRQIAGYDVDWLVGRMVRVREDDKEDKSGARLSVSAPRRCTPES